MLSNFPKLIVLNFSIFDLCHVSVYDSQFMIYLIFKLLCVNFNFDFELCFNLPFNLCFNLTFDFGFNFGFNFWFRFSRYSL